MSLLNVFQQEKSYYNIAEVTYPKVLAHLKKVENLKSKIQRDIEQCLEIPRSSLHHSDLIKKMLWSQLDSMMIDLYSYENLSDQIKNFVTYKVIKGTKQSILQKNIEKYFAEMRKHFEPIKQIFIVAGIDETRSEGLLQGMFLNIFERQKVYEVIAEQIHDPILGKQIYTDLANIFKKHLKKRSGSKTEKETIQKVFHSLQIAIISWLTNTVARNSTKTIHELKKASQLTKYMQAKLFSPLKNKEISQKIPLNNGLITEAKTRKQVREAEYFTNDEVFAIFMATPIIETWKRIQDPLVKLKELQQSENLKPSTIQNMAYSLRTPLLIVAYHASGDIINVPFEELITMSPNRFGNFIDMNTDHVVFDIQQEKIKFKLPNPIKDPEQPEPIHYHECPAVHHKITKPNNETTTFLATIIDLGIKLYLENYLLKDKPQSAPCPFAKKT